MDYEQIALMTVYLLISYLYMCWCMYVVFFYIGNKSLITYYWKTIKWIGSVVRYLF